MLSKLKWKAATIFFGVHAGLFLGLYGVFQLQEPGGGFHPAFPWVMGSVIAAYCSFWLACFFVYAPLAPWITRARSLLNWRHWILSELPTLITMVPIVVGLIQAWRMRQAADGRRPMGTPGPSDLTTLSRWISKTLEGEPFSPQNVRPMPQRTRKPRAASRKPRKAA